MRKFLAKSFVFLLGISLLFNLSGTLADQVAPLEDWRFENHRLESLWERHDVIEAITLGNSHSDAVDYPVLGIEGQSLAFPAADLFEVEKYAGYVDNELPNLKMVFITISYYSFRWDNAAFEPYRSRRIRYYAMIPIRSPIKGDMPNYLLGKVGAFTHVMSVVRSDHWFGVWMNLAGNAHSANATDYDGVITESVWGLCPHYTAEQLETHALNTAKRNIIDSEGMANIHPQLERDAYDALARTIERLQSKGIRVVLYTPTFYEKYSRYFMEDGSGIVDDMSGKIDRLRQAYHVEYYDFSSDPEIMIHPELFYNSDHLSECGQKVFSAKLLQLMNENVR